MNVDLLRLVAGDRALRDTEANFDRLVNLLFYVAQTETVFVDASSGAVSKYLPDGASPQLKQYIFVKTDSSANAVTIYPFGTQLIDAGASTALAAQSDSVHLVFDKASQTWWSI